MNKDLLSIVGIGVVLLACLGVATYLYRASEAEEQRFEQRTSSKGRGKQRQLSGAGWCRTADR